MCATEFCSILAYSTALNSSTDLLLLNPGSLFLLMSKLEEQRKKRPPNMQTFQRYTSSSQ